MLRVTTQLHSTAIAAKIQVYTPLTASNKVRCYHLSIHPFIHSSITAGLWQSRFTPLEEDFYISSGGHSEEAHPLSAPVSRRELDIQLSSKTNQFGPASNVQPAPLTIWQCAHSRGVSTYCYAELTVLPYCTITLAHVMSRENFSRGGFPLPSPRFRIRSMLLP